MRVVGPEVPDREGGGKGELIAVITTITGMRRSTQAAALAEAYHQRWEHETGNDQLKTHLRGPRTGAAVQESRNMVHQEIYGYLLAHWAISGLICQAATEADIDPDRVKFTRTIASSAGPSSPAFTLDRAEKARAAIIMADIAGKRNLNPGRRHRTYPRVVKRARHNSYRVETRRQGHPPRSAADARWSTCTNPAWQPDQNRLSGIASRWRIALFLFSRSPTIAPRAARWVIASPSSYMAA